MDLALRTTASPAAIWVIVVVAVVLLAFWLFMVMVFATRPDPRLQPAAGRPGRVLGGIPMAAGGRAPGAGRFTRLARAARCAPGVPNSTEDAFARLRYR
jgi:hypothetical protein